MQLMIYVGGTLVLLIFGVMLTAQARFISMRTRSGEWVCGIDRGQCLLLVPADRSPPLVWNHWRDLPAGELAGVSRMRRRPPHWVLDLSGVRVDKLNEADADDARRACPGTCCRS